MRPTPMWRHYLLCHSLILHIQKVCFQFPGKGRDFIVLTGRDCVERWPTSCLTPIPINKTQLNSLYYYVEYVEVEEEQEVVYQWTF